MAERWDPDYLEKAVGEYEGWYDDLRYIFLGLSRVWLWVERSPITYDHLESLMADCRRQDWLYTINSLTLGYWSGPEEVTALLGRLKRLFPYCQRQADRKSALEKVRLRVEGFFGPDSEEYRAWEKILDRLEWEML